MQSRAWIGAAIVLSAATVQARAQDSQFGIAGLGTPGRSESVRARSAGGGFAPFDPLSALTEASLTEVGGLAATASSGTSYRDVQVPASSTWLRTTRFPLFSLAGRVGHVFLGGGFSSFIDRSYAVVTEGSMPLRGITENFTDQIASDGGIADLHIGAATKLGSHLSFGLGVHFMPGSTRETATRTFADTLTYDQVRQNAQVRYEAIGVSASALFKLTQQFSLVAFGRANSDLKQYLGDTLQTTTTLPKTIGGGLRWIPTNNVRFAGSVTWSSWADAGSTASNTLNWSLGAEVGPGAPLRLGVRGGQLPFGGSPSEWGVSVGTGRSFAKGHGYMDFGLERLARDGSGLHERVWTVLLGMTVRP